MQNRSNKDKTSRKGTNNKQQQQAEQASANGMESLKSRLKNMNPGGLLDMLNKVKNTTPDQWKDANAVKDMAKQFADKLNIPVSDERLDQFLKAYKDATKGGEPTADVDELVQKYGKGKVDQQTLNEMKKFIKPKK